MTQAGDQCCKFPVHRFKDFFFAKSEVGCLATGSLGESAAPEIDSCRFAKSLGLRGYPARPESCISSYFKWSPAAFRVAVLYDLTCELVVTEDNFQSL